MQVPTYRKFGLTKSQIEAKDNRDRRISDILTHYLTIIIGSAFGITVYILNYTRVDPSNLFQMLVQIFLFASIGILCVGVPAIFFKFIEMTYFKIVETGDEHKTIEKYSKERSVFEFWKLRKDYSFWRILDGLSFDKEVMNVLLNSGYRIDELKNNNGKYVIIEKDNKPVYVVLNTRAMEISDIAYIDNVLNEMSLLNCYGALIFSQRGFTRKIIEYSKGKDIELFDINGIIKLIKSLNLNYHSDN